MKKKIKIETLTDVHIGSGNELAEGIDFIKGEENINGEDYNCFGIIDIDKLSHLIGEERFKDWMLSIRDPNKHKSFIKKINGKNQLSNISKRVVLDYTNESRGRTIKEQLHDGRGIPYIPGSSIKGAIRSAILSVLIASLKLENRVMGFMRDSRIKLKCEEIEKRLFGDRSGALSSDFFRYLQVGDAFFGDNYEQVINIVYLNESRNQGAFLFTQRNQFIETIPPVDESTFSLKLNVPLYKKNRENLVHKEFFDKLLTPNGQLNVEALFKMLQDHIKPLLQQEIDYWSEREDEDAILDYIDAISDIKKEAEKCQPNECILRIGHGIGWNFITGGWARKLPIFKNEIVRSARPRNDRYREFDFPKTRKVDVDINLLGFVKLTYSNA